MQSESSTETTRRLYIRVSEQNPAVRWHCSRLSSLCVFCFQFTFFSTIKQKCKLTAKQSHGKLQVQSNHKMSIFCKSKLSQLSLYALRFSAFRDESYVGCVCVRARGKKRLCGEKFDDLFMLTFFILTHSTLSQAL